MRLLTACTALVLLAGPAGEAAAKEVVSVTACGPSDCRSTRDRDVIGVVESGGTPSIGEAASRAGWYRLRARIRLEGAHDEHFSIVFIPRTRMLRMGDEASGYAWTLLSTAQADVVRGLVRGIEPFPAAKLRGVGSATASADTDPPAPPASTSSGSDGGASPLRWIGGGLLLAGALLALFLRRRGWRRPRPSAG